VGRGEMQYIQYFGEETKGKETTWKTGVDGRIILKRILRREMEVID
jgi:hypothetical protein